MEKSENKKPIGVLLGPTASGKTALSIALAKALDANIISADSIQVYRGMDIGSAKPSEEERQGIPHYMMDVVEPDAQGFSVAAYQRMAFDAIETIRGQGKFPLVVGGTGLYINALTYPLQFTSIPSDEALRTRLIEEENANPGCLLERLKKVDPASGERLHPNDKKRIVRALEVYELSGKPLSDFGTDFANAADLPIPYAPRIVGLTMQRETLYKRIEMRVDAMMRDGLLAEVESLLQRGYDERLPAMQGLGYKQLCGYFRGDCTLDEAVETIKRETRHFAKRQMTWFRRDKRIVWLDAEALSFEELLQSAIAVMEGSPANKSQA